MPQSPSTKSSSALDAKVIKVSQWELKILCVLIGQRLYGIEIQDAIEDKYGELISDGTLYTTLHRMDKKGFLEPSWGNSSDSCHGARRKYYTVTCEGIKAIKSVQLNDISRKHVLGDVLGESSA